MDVLAQVTSPDSSTGSDLRRGSRAQWTSRAPKLKRVTKSSTKGDIDVG
jgi:hypothetical protein